MSNGKSLNVASWCLFHYLLDINGYFITLLIYFILQNKELLENRKSRKNRWDEFLQGQYQNCDEIDKDFNEQVERLKKHYDELEDKLGYSTKTLHDWFKY